MNRLIKTCYPFLLLLILFCSISLPTMATSMEATETEEKVVYLTFDDGPTPKITDQILDQLKKNNVKATFFIVGKEIKGRETILKRIYDEGHGIGLHTYSHNFKIIYKSPENFIAEMDKTKSTINEVLGTNLDIKVIRFPGGSAGRLNKNFYNKLCESGYLIYDWNVDLQDGIKGNLSPQCFLENSKKCMDKSTRRIILAHCNSNNQNTCAALDQIIAYYTKEGYVFKAINHTTAPYYYRFKN
ncbi:MAG: polysaccharide deacetylase [Cellulosilyticum sp.]|nr:polysaccharide deacetylase [Cellulosilyticum sp.]